MKKTELKVVCNFCYFFVDMQSLEEQLAKLTADFEKATAEKLRCQEEADATSRTIQLANRLVGGLSSENVRWAEAVAKYVESHAKSVKLK